MDQGLNDSQKRAIEFALAARHVALIHGPPGVSMLAILDSLLHSDSARQEKRIR